MTNDQEQVCASPEDQDAVMFIGDTTCTLSEVFDLTHHLSANPIGNTQRNANGVLQFTYDKRMQLIGEKCKEMVIDFRKIKTEIPRAIK